MQTITLPLASVRTDGGTQSRVRLDESVIAEYTQTMQSYDTDHPDNRRSAPFDPINVMYDGSHYWLYDGFHRHAAHQNAGREQIDVIVQQGTQQDAIWHSFAANSKHGLRRSTLDKQTAIRAALLHPNGANLSNRAIAQHVGVDHTTVGTMRATLEAEGLLQPQTSRTGADGRTIQTGNITEANRARPARAAMPDHQPDNDEPDDDDDQYDDDEEVASVAVRPIATPSTPSGSTSIVKDSAPIRFEEEPTPATTTTTDITQQATLVELLRCALRKAQHTFEQQQQSLFANGQEADIRYDSAAVEQQADALLTMPDVQSATMLLAFSTTIEIVDASDEA